MQLEWKPARGAISVGEELWLGRVPVGHIHVDAMRPRSAPPAFVAVCTLPGLTPIDERFPGPEEAKAKVVSTVRFWIDVAGLATVRAMPR